MSPLDLPLNCILSVAIPPSLLWDRRLHKSPWVLGHPGNTRLHHWRRNVKWLASWATAKWAWQRAHSHSGPNHSTSSDCWRRSQQKHRQKTGLSAVVFLAGSALPLLTEFNYNHTMIIDIISCELFASCFFRARRQQRRRGLRCFHWFWSASQWVRWREQAIIFLLASVIVIPIRTSLYHNRNKTWLCKITS